MEAGVAGPMLAGGLLRQHEHKQTLVSAQSASVTGMVPPGTGQCCTRGASALPACTGLSMTRRRSRATSMAVRSATTRSFSSSHIVCEAQETLTETGGIYSFFPILK